MRLILVGLYLFLYFTVGMLYLGAEWLFGRWNQKASMLRQYRFVQWGFRCLLFISGVKVHAKGTENVPKDEAVLYVANHRGIFDVLVTAIYCKGVTGYISKIVIKKVPCLRVYMKRIGCLFMDREDIKQSLKIILEAIEQVKNGISIFIFPEGTRNKNREDATDIATFKEGSFKVAQKSGCRIIPVAITGTAEIFEDHLPWIHGGHVYVTFGEPIDMKTLDKEEQKHIGEYCKDRIHNLLVEQQA